MENKKTNYGWVIVALFFQLSICNTRWPLLPGALWRG